MKSINKAIINKLIKDKNILEININENSQLRYKTADEEVILNVAPITREQMRMVYNLTKTRGKVIKKNTEYIVFEINSTNKAIVQITADDIKSIIIKKYNS